jgi:hypothetical protein
MWSIYIAVGGCLIIILIVALREKAQNRKIDLDDISGSIYFLFLSGLGGLVVALVLGIVMAFIPEKAQVIVDYKAKLKKYNNEYYHIDGVICSFYREDRGFDDCYSLEVETVSNVAINTSKNVDVPEVIYYKAISIDEKDGLIHCFAFDLGNLGTYFYEKIVLFVPENL